MRVLALISGGKVKFNFDLCSTIDRRCHLQISLRDGLDTIKLIEGH